jgi:predicted flap endonuclease-1-like 5' DNA nuclease
MMYLIGQLAIWLLLAAFFAALAGWSLAAHQAVASDERRNKARDKLVGDLSNLAGGEARAAAPSAPDGEGVRSLTAIREARVSELERNLQEQRARADSLAAELAEHQRSGQDGGADNEELQHLRAQLAAHEAAAASPAPTPALDPDAALQGWRLRYFEQRVRYLEGAHQEAVAARPASTPEAVAASEPVAHAPAAALADWRAREAEARAQFLAEQLRRPPPPEPQTRVDEDPASPFAANADIDALLRWRMLYLERRAAHLEARAAQPASPAASTPADHGPDPDRWKWRARYLESRVRRLEERAAAAAPQTPARQTPPMPPAVKEERPPGLPAAQDGAADDFTLIDNIGPLQQTTLYSLGIYHFDQIAAWTPANVAWVDRYLRLQGRIEDEEWLAQAADLVREGPQAARRQSEEEDA